MNSSHLLELALGIHSPWEVVSSKLEDLPLGKELHIHIDFKRGSRFANDMGELCEVHDTLHKTWRHLSFFEHAYYLHCRVPRIKSKDGKVKLVEEFPGLAQAVDSHCCLKLT